MDTVVRVHQVVMEGGADAEAQVVLAWRLGRQRLQGRDFPDEVRLPPQPQNIRPLRSGWLIFFSFNQGLL